MDAGDVTEIIIAGLKGHPNIPCVRGRVNRVTEGLKSKPIIEFSFVKIRF